MRALDDDGVAGEVVVQRVDAVLDERQHVHGRERHEEDEGVHVDEAPVVGEFSGEVPRDLHHEDEGAAGQEEDGVEGHGVAHVDPFGCCQENQQHEQQDEEGGRPDVGVAADFHLWLLLLWRVGRLRVLVIWGHSRQAHVGNPHSVDQPSSMASPMIMMRRRVDREMLFPPELKF